MENHLLGGVAVLLAEVEVCAGGARVLRRDVVDTPADGKLRVKAVRVRQDGGGRCASSCSRTEAWKAGVAATSRAGTMVTTRPLYSGVPRLS